MGRQWPFFGKKQPEPEPVRAEQVERLANLLAEEDDAMLFDAPGSPYYAQSQALLEAALRHSTDAELRAARALRYQESKDGPDSDLRRPSTPKPSPPGVAHKFPPNPQPCSCRHPYRRYRYVQHRRGSQRPGPVRREVRTDLGRPAAGHARNEEIQQLLTQATNGSNQTSAQQAIGLYAQSKESLGELQSVLQAAMSSADEYAAGL